MSVDKSTFDYFKYSYSIQKCMKLRTGGLTCSAGVACNSDLAKICSDMNKPDGQYLLPPTRRDVLAFMRALPVRKLRGVGKVTERVLEALHISVCNELHEQRFADGLHFVCELPRIIFGKPFAVGRISALGKA